MTDNTVPCYRTALAAIEGYLEQHPDAADSSQGIAQWWLPAYAAGVPVVTVEHALADLQQRGLVRRTQLPGGQVIWSAQR